jgi:hypothetical protein
MSVCLSVCLSVWLAGWLADWLSVWLAVAVPLTARVACTMMWYVIVMNCVDTTMCDLGDMCFSDAMKCDNNSDCNDGADEAGCDPSESTCYCLLLYFSSVYGLTVTVAFDFAAPNPIG